MTRISKKAGAIAESATLAVDAKAKALAAAGKKIINFGAGEPDFATPDFVVEAAKKAASNPKFHHYTPVPGLPDLRQAVAAKTFRDSGIKVQPNQVLITNGAKQAIFNSFITLLDPGDEVLVPAPFWVTYPECIKLAGGRPVEVATTQQSGFRVTLESLNAALTPKTKVLLMVSPSNPTGTVYSKTELTAIGKWAAAKNLWVVTDEIYEYFVYGKARFYSLPALVPELAERCVIINGVSKSFAMTGWRVGWMVGPADVIKAASSLQSHSTSNAANISQAAALAALNGDLSSVKKMRGVFEKRRAVILKALHSIPGIVCHEPEGAFYVFPCVQNFLGKKIGGRRLRSSLDLAELLLDKAGVAVVPGEAFGAPGYIRMSYALGDDDLKQGLQQMQKLLKNKEK